MRRVLSISLFLVTSAFALAKPILAQISLGISPPLIEVMIQPGKSMTQAYEIINDSSQDLYLQAKVVPFEPSDEKGNVRLLEEQENRFFSLNNSDLNLNQTFKLSANSRQQLVLRISVPKTEPDTDYYYTLLIEQSPQGDFAPIGTGNQNLIKIGSNILLTVSQTGVPARHGFINQFTATPKIADLLEKVNLKVLIQNTGNALFKAVGEIKIEHRIFRNKKETLTLRPDNVLASSVRQIICQDQEEECSFSTLLPGPYKATVSFSPEGTGSQEEKTINFWVLPIKSFLVLVTLLILIWQIGKKYIKGLDK